MFFFQRITERGALQWQIITGRGTELLHCFVLSGIQTVIMLFTGVLRMPRHSVQDCIILILFDKQKQYDLRNKIIKIKSAK